MPGRLRKGTGVSDKAQNCCNKCCQACCRLSPWNKVMCYSMSFLILGSILVLIVGAFAASDTNNSSDDICTADLVGFGGSSSNNTATDPVIPILNKNAYIWWLSNAGIFCIIMIIMSCLCCFSYITLCCGFKFPAILKILAVIGLVILLIGLSLYVVWLGFGTYLITLYGPSAIFEKICRGVLFYVIFMYVYLISFVVAAVAAILFTMCGGGKEDENKKSRDSVKSNLKMPPTKMLTAMV